jgi:hypothetical protein
MATEGISPAAWKQRYQFALLETDPAKLPRRVADAHTAICDRIRELHSSPACDEHLALKSALRFLRILERETLEERKTA